MPNRRRPRALMLAVILAAVLGPLALSGGSRVQASQPRAESNRQPSSAARSTVRQAGPLLADQQFKAQSLAAAEDLAATEVSRQRREIHDYLVHAYAGPFSQLNTLAPLDEALLGVDTMSDVDVTRIYDAVPLIQHWKTIEARQAQGFQAAPSRTTGQPAGTFSPDEEEELEQVRDDMLTVVEVQSSWVDLFGIPDPTFPDRAADINRLLQDATYEDLSGLRDALAIIPDWQHVLTPDLHGLMGGDGGFAAMAQKSGNSPDALDVLDEQCSQADYDRDTLPLVIAAAALEGVRLGAEFAARFAAKDIKICIGIFGATVCADFPNPIFFILKFIEFGVGRARDGIQAAIDVANVCQSIAHWKVTIKHHDEFLKDAQTVITGLITRDNEIVERSERVDFTNREAWKLQLQLSIEENLLLPAPQDSGIDENRISLFQLTDTVCFNPDELLPTPVFALPTPVVGTPQPTAVAPPILAPFPTSRTPFVVADRREQCGIELVKRIVEEAIDINQLAGNDVHNAEEYKAAADVHYNARRFKDAYDRYREAYQAAVQPDNEPRGPLSGERAPDR